MMNVQIRMVHDASHLGPKLYRGVPDACRQIYAAEGFRQGFFSGQAPNILKGGVTNGVRFLVYNQLKRYVLDAEAAAAAAGAAAQQPPRELTSNEAFWFGAASGGASVFFSHPIDTVKSVMMSLERGKYRSSWDCTKHIWRTGGAGAFFNGVGPRAVRVPLEVGLQFLLFEKLSVLLGPAF